MGQLAVRNYDVESCQEPKRKDDVYVSVSEPHRRLIKGIMTGGDVIGVDSSTGASVRYMSV